MKKRMMAILLAAGMALAACSSEDSSTDTSTGDDSAAEVSGDLVVFAAASLTDVFDEGIAQLEDQYPDLNITANYAGSSDLAAQLSAGAVADVLATADIRNMDLVVDEELITDTEIFATNHLVIAVAEGNPLGIEGLADLTSEDIVTVICAPAVPCGGATQTLFEQQDVDVPVVSEEQSVTAVLGTVSSGQADAGLVYATDIARASGVESVDAEGAEEIINEYPIGVLSEAPNPEAAAVFVEFFTTGAGRQLLTDAGFGAP